MAQLIICCTLSAYIWMITWGMLKPARLQEISRSHLLPENISPVMVLLSINFIYCNDCGCCCWLHDSSSLWWLYFSQKAHCFILNVFKVQNQFFITAITGNNPKASESPAFSAFDDKSQPSNSGESKKRPAGHYRLVYAKEFSFLVKI